MKNTEFVEAIKKYVRDTSLSDTIDFIQKPPGRKPRKRHLELSNWYNGLSNEDKRMVFQMMTEAVDSSLFGLLSVLDGARIVEETEEKSTFELYCSKGGHSLRLNDTDGEPLHDIYNALTNPID